MAFQQHVLEVAGGASSHCYDALKLAFGNTIDAIKQERKKIADEQEARKEAEKRATIEAEKQAAIEAVKRELMQRPMLTCEWGCHGQEVSIQQANSLSNCRNCGRSFVCSKCRTRWGRTGVVCGSCGEAFR